MDGARQSPEAVFSPFGDGGVSGAAAKLCMAVGCDAMLSELPKYCQQRRLCPVHLKAPALKRKQYKDDSLWRFCQQCGKLEPLHAFDGTKRSCRIQLAKRRASSFNKGSASSSSTAGTSSLSRTVTGGIRKTASFSGNPDRGALLNGQLSDPQLMLTQPLQQQQQQQQQQQSYAEFSESQEFQETDLSGKLLQLKQQVAMMEQQLSLLQEQQQMEAELIALQQQYQRTLQNASMQSCTMPEPASAPQSSVGLGARHADRTFSAPVPCLSAPGCSTQHASGIRRPSTPTWSAGAVTAPGMLGGMQPMTAPVMQSCSMPLQLPTSAGAAAVAAAGFGAIGHASGPGWLLYDSCVINSTIMSSNSLNMQPMQHSMMPAGAAAAAAAAQAQMARQAQQHTDVWSVAHSMQMNNVPMSTDAPDLQQFIAAGGKLQADCHSASQNGFNNDSSPTNSRPLCSSSGGCYSPERPPLGPSMLQPKDSSQGTAGHMPLSLGSLERVQGHAEMLPGPMQAAGPMHAAMANGFGDAHWPMAADQDHGMPFGRRSLETFAGLLEEVLQEIQAEDGSDMMMTA